MLILSEFTTPILMSKYPFRATMYNNGPTEYIENRSKKWDFIKSILFPLDIIGIFYQQIRFLLHTVVHLESKSPEPRVNKKA
jgi:hypothetical protein